MAKLESWARSRIGHHPLGGAAGGAGGDGCIHNWPKSPAPWGWRAAACEIYRPRLPRAAAVTISDRLPSGRHLRVILLHRAGAGTDVDPLTRGVTRISPADPCVIFVWLFVFCVLTPTYRHSCERRPMNLSCCHPLRRRQPHCHHHRFVDHLNLLSCQRWCRRTMLLYSSMNWLHFHRTSPNSHHSNLVNKFLGFVINLSIGFCGFFFI